MARQKRHRRQFEHVQVDGLRQHAAAILVLEHALDRARRGGICSVAVVLESDGGYFDCKMSGNANVAERLGRLRLIEEEILARAEDDGELSAPSSEA